MSGFLHLLLLLVLLHQLILEGCHILLAILRTEVLVFTHIGVSIGHQFLGCSKDHLLTLQILARLSLLIILVNVSTYLPSHAWFLVIRVTITLGI